MRVTVNGAIGRRGLGHVASDPGGGSVDYRRRDHVDGDVRLLQLQDGGLRQGDHSRFGRVERRRPGRVSSAARLPTSRMRPPPSRLCD